MIEALIPLGQFLLGLAVGLLLIGFGYVIGKRERNKT